MGVDVIIPAHNEEEHLGGVLDAVCNSNYVGRVIVVADDCQDNTHQLAMAYTSTVLPAHFSNKGSAMSLGLAYSSSPYIAFIDGDIDGLTSDHVDELLGTPCEGQVAGVFPWNNLKVPPITGQRKVPTWVAERAGLYQSGWEAEHRINATIGRHGLPWYHFHLHGVKHTSKIGKHDAVGWGKTMWYVTWGSLKYSHDLLNYMLFPEGRNVSV